MNKDGHSKSLVPAHPENTNAVKAGVFSPRILAARVAEVEAELASQSRDETFEEVLRQEIAGLTILSQAMDASLEEDGIRGRGGEPRSLIDRRLRVNDRLRRTLELYMQTERVEPEALSVQAEESTETFETFLDALARSHFRDSVRLIRPRDFDPETFLQTMIETSDPVVRFEDARRARQLLTKRERQRVENCVCWTTLLARDETELRDWINEAGASGVEPNEHDAWLAGVVRSLTRERRLEDEPYFRYKRTLWAVQEIVEAGVDRVKGVSREKAAAAALRTKEQDHAVAPFWKALLSSSTRVTPKKRLQAFASLDELGVLPRCTCHHDAGELAEEKYDAARAHIIQSVGQRHYRAAKIIAAFPETFYAVRDAIDVKVAADVEAESSSDEN